MPFDPNEHECREDYLLDLLDVINDQAKRAWDNQDSNPLAVLTAVTALRLAAIECENELRLHLNIAEAVPAESPPVAPPIDRTVRRRRTTRKLHT